MERIRKDAKKAYIAIEREVREVQERVLCLNMSALTHKGQWAL